jgi:hypothetical protein
MSIAGGGMSLCLIKPRKRSQNAEYRGKVLIISGWLLFSDLRLLVLG